MGLPFSVLPDLKALSLSPPGSAAKPNATKGDRLAFAKALSQVERPPEAKGSEPSVKTPDSPASQQEAQPLKDPQGAAQPSSKKPEAKSSDPARSIDEKTQGDDSTDMTVQNPAPEATLPAQPLSPQDMAQFASLLVQAPSIPKSNETAPATEGVQLAKSLTILSAQDSVAQATMATLKDSKPATEFAGLQAQPLPETPGQPLLSPKASDFASKLAEAQGQIPAELQAKLAMEPQPGLVIDAKASTQLVESNQPAPPELAAALQQPSVSQVVAPKSIASRDEGAIKSDSAVSGAAKPEAVLDPAAADPAKQTKQESNSDASPDGQQDSSPKAPKPPMSPVASQSAPQSVESLRAADQMTALRQSNRVELAEPSRVSEPTPETASSAPLSSSGLETEATTVEVHPWELPLGVQNAEAPTARPLDQGVPKGEALPMREAMKAPFVEAAKHPGKPAELRLELAPEHLGRMEIRVMAHEGTVSAQIRVDHAGTRDLLQVQLAELRTSLADQGIKIDKLEVNVGQDQRRSAPDFGMAGGFQQGPGQGQNQQQPDQAATMGSRYLNFDGLAADSEEEALPEGGRHALAGGTAGIDFQA